MIISKLVGQFDFEVFPVEHVIEVDSIPTPISIVAYYSQEQYSPLIHQLMRNGEAVIYVESVSDFYSLENVKRNVENLIDTKERVPPLVFVINKVDLDQSKHVVTKDAIEKLVKKPTDGNYLIVKASGLTGENVTMAFEEVIRRHRHQCFDQTNTLQEIKSILKNDRSTFSN